MTRSVPHMDDPRRSERTRPWIRCGAFVGIGALALGLRLWGIAFAWGIPRGRPDEELYFLPAMKMFGSGGSQGLLDFGFTEGFALILHGLLRVHARLLAWWYGQPVNLGCLFVLDPTRLLLVGRVFSATAGVLTLVPTALLARRLVAPAESSRAALAAALLLAVNYLHGRDSHFAVPDASLACALAWAVLAVVRFAEDGRERHALYAAVATGLAVALKWTGLFVVPLFGLSLLFSIWRRRRSQLGLQCLIAGAAVAVALATFLALDPHVLAEWEETNRGLWSHLVRYGGEAAEHSMDQRVVLSHGIVFHSLVTLPVACGWLGLVAALFGLACAFRQNAIAASACLLFLTFLYGIALGPSLMLFVRYCVPVIPVLAALAAAGLVEGAQRIARASSRSAFQSFAFVALVATAALPPASRLVTVDRLLARADSRELATRWIRDHAPEESTVVGETGYTDVYGIESAGIQFCQAQLPSALRTRPNRLPGSRRDWKRDIPGGIAGWGPLAEVALDDYWGGNPSMNPDFLVRGWVILSCGEPAPVQYMAPVPPTCLEEVARFSPGTPSCRAVYDLFDQFYLPYSGFLGIERPGPEVVVYRYCKQQIR